MAGRDGKKRARKAGRRLLVGVGAGAGVFLAAAAMATGSAVTAAPAHADFEDLLDPIIQPLLTSFTDSLSAIDPAAAVDLTSWTDSLLSSLSSVDLALPAAAEPASVAAAVAEPAATAPATADIPISIGEGTEPTVAATVDGSSTSLLVDTGSSGLVVPLTSLDSGSNELSELLNLGLPSGIDVSGYGTGVEYVYLTYDNASVDYGGVDTTAPVEVEVYSYDPSDFSSLFTNDAFQNFLSDNDATGILGIGNDVSGSAGESPLEAAGYTGVTVDVPGHELVVGDTNADATANSVTVSGAPTPSDSLTETVTNGSETVGSATVSDDVDSGGVYGNIPSSLGSVPDGDTISVSDGSSVLYFYTVADNGTLDAPTVLPADDTVSGVTDIDSGFAPYYEEPIYIDYTNDTLTFDSP